MKKNTQLNRAVLHAPRRAPSIKEALAISGAAVAWDFVLLDRELVIVRDFLPLGNVTLGKDHNLFLSIRHQDIRVAIGLQQKSSVQTNKQGNR